MGGLALCNVIFGGKFVYGLMRKPSGEVVIVDDEDEYMVLKTTLPACRKQTKKAVDGGDLVYCIFNRGMVISMIYIFFGILIILFFLIFLTKKTKRKKWNHVLYVLVVLVIVSFVTGVIISNLNQKSNYDKNDVTLKENEKIDVKILDVNAEQIQVQIKNNDSPIFKYTDYFLCMKKEHGKWKYMKFGWDATFSKCVYELENGQKKTRSINWKDYFGHKLKKGEYRLIWVDELEFEIN